MELVYLWVEKYKNIENQGFNFSPRFECSYDGAKLIICDKKKNECKDNNYIENFFGEKINVTAIVGENGSGKSSVLELFYFREDTSLKYDFFYILQEGELLNFYGNKQSKNLILIDDLTYEKQEFPLENEAKYKNDIAFFSPTINHTFSLNSSNKYNYSISSLLVEETKDYKIDFSSMYRLYKSNRIKDSLKFLKEADINLSFKIPTKLSIVTYYIEEQDKKYINNISCENEFLSILKSKMIVSCAKKDERLDDEKIKDKKTLDEIIETLDEKENIKNFISIIEKYGQKGKTLKNELELDLKDVEEDLFDEYSKISKICGSFLKFDWYDNLSAGENNFIFQLGLFYRLIEEYEDNNLLLLIDEGESTLHPDWQRKYLKELITFFDKYRGEKNIHIVGHL